MGTLTYRGSGVHDPKQVRTDVAAFFRSLRSALGGRALPYVWVPEWHKTDHGLHLHFGVGQYVNYRLIRDTWGHGFIHIKRLADLPVGSTSLHEARRVAGYLSKYVTKDFDRDDGARALRLHRYDLAQGFAPRAVRLWECSADAALARAIEVMGVGPTRSWSSAEVEDWPASPAVHHQWG